MMEQNYRSEQKQSREESKAMQIVAGQRYTAVVNAVNLKQTDDLYRFEFNLSFVELQNKAVNRNVMLSRKGDINAMLSVIVRYQQLTNNDAKRLFADFGASLENGEYKEVCDWASGQFVGKSLVIEAKENYKNPSLPFLNFVEIKD